LALIEGVAYETTYTIYSGIARILGDRVLEYAHAKRAHKILAMPTYELERSKFKMSQRMHSEHSYMTYM
jgi:hypothetical protein